MTQGLSEKVGTGFSVRQAELGNVPALRFPEFEGEWQEKRLGDGVGLLSGQHLGPDEYANTAGGDPYFTGPSDFTDDENQLTKWTLVEGKTATEGDVLLTVKGNGVGELTLLKLPKVAMGRQLMAVRGRGFDTEIVAQVLLSRRAELQALASGNLIPGLSRPAILNLKVCFPSLPEQKKIAAFLGVVDAKIAALRERRAGLTRYKRGLMQALFSQTLRFTRSDGTAFPDWEEKRLGEVAHTTTGDSNREDSTVEGRYAFFDRSDDVRHSARYLFDGEAIIVAGEGSGFVPRYFVGKFDLHQRTYATMNFKSAVGKFVYYWMYYNRHHFLSVAVGSTVPSLRLPMFQKFPLSLPHPDEQAKIADALSAMDAKIAAVGDQVTQMEAFKKGLLQQMFV